jgi:hypothetical protein
MALDWLTCYAMRALAMPCEQVMEPEVAVLSKDCQNRSCETGSKHRHLAHIEIPTNTGHPEHMTTVQHRTQANSLHHKLTRTSSAMPVNPGQSWL